VPPQRPNALHLSSQLSRESRAPAFIQGVRGRKELTAPFNARPKARVLLNFRIDARTSATTTLSRTCGQRFSTQLVTQLTPFRSPTIKSLAW